MSITPRAHDNRIPPRGWRADDLTPEMIEPYRARFGTYFTTSTETECWIWRGATITNGYGRFYRSSRERPTGWLAHRMAWVFATATALTDSLTIDHKCRVPLCVNPAHLEPVTLAENVARAQRAPLADTCRNGHEGEIHTTSGGKRDCRQCHRDRVAEHSRRRRAARSAARAMPPAYDTSKWAR